MSKLSSKEIERYSKQLSLPEIGELGQQKLKNSSVLIVGAGGLASPVSYYLAAAGVGKLGIIDADKVELSNLQRQILHRTADLDRLKVESARDSLEALNSNLEISTYQDFLDFELAKKLFREYDLVVDCVDNFATRYLVNDAAVETNTPLIEAGVAAFEGQLMLIDPPQGPCYRCIFPEQSTTDSPERGLLGVIPGTIGTLQATEAIKYLLGLGRLLLGRLLVYDGLELSFREVEIKRNSSCSVCGDK
ncbi:HesA/MoeB/ThiF family protein [Fuchsiella alkaliacetigena]|uniref:HesA/MoeB/ThiF family protein n=1 Tax=Fuchsiella alkaliacetigena TaxID=957042 RepID=UPI00200B0882|nr:HesA/MoeB/ThiF family protein [Fuchsiella alkaliacetigena]MCK8824422.1 HesA/MoeB/ThiF family protein [Fuchsiella alkaliacetigena]